ncbi:MAG: hypothetical protein V3R45_09490 [Candidatus Aminicenantaceae bacterium]
MTLTAKEKICFNPEKKCTGDECLFARGYYDRLPEAQDAIFSRATMNRGSSMRIFILA